MTPEQTMAVVQGLLEPRATELGRQFIAFIREPAEID